MLLCIKGKNHKRVRFVVISKANHLENHVSSVHGGKNQIEFKVQKSMIGCINTIRKFCIFFTCETLVCWIILVKLWNCICKPQKHKFYFVHNKSQKSIQFSSGQISKINGTRMTLRSEYAFYPMFSLMSDCTNISINV